MRLKERLAQLERQAERQTERQAKRQAKRQDVSSFLQPAGEDSVLTDPYDRHDHCHARAMDQAQIYATEPTGPVVQPALDIPCIQRARDNGTASYFSHHHFTSSRHASKSPPPLDSTAYSTPEDTASEDVEYLLYPYLEPSYIISGNTFAGLLDPSTPPMFPLPAMECGGSVDPTCHYPAIAGIDDLTWDYE